MAENHIHAELKSKYDEALSKYNCNISDAEVAEAVKKIITEATLAKEKAMKELEEINNATKE